MTLKEFATMLNSLGYDVAKDEFPLDYNASCPYIIYEVVGTNNIKADNHVYQKVLLIEVSIFTKGHADETAQAALEALFDENDIPWDFEGNFDHDQYDYEVVYSIEIEVSHESESDAGDA